jgi:UDP-glucuronate 4-epimerase
MKKILITGSAGFIGFHLTKHLLEATDFEVIGVDNINSYYDIRLKLDRLEELGVDTSELLENQKQSSRKYSQLRFYKTDLRDSINLKAIFKTHQPEIVCHLAAQAGVRYSITHPQEYISNNVEGFFNIIKQSQESGIKHFVYASSSSIYGNSSEQPYNESQNTDKPVSLYAATKKSNELIAHVYSSIHGLVNTGLRFFTVYGSWGRPDMAPILFSKAIADNKKIKVFNHGNLMRDFTYIDDIIEGLNAVILQNVEERTEKYKIYNIGRGKPEKLMDFIALIEQNLNKEASKEYLEMQAGDVESTFADISALTADFEYSPKTDIETGIPLFINWFKEYYAYNKNSGK